MIPVSAYDGSRVAVFGLGGSGLATARALAAGGADVLAFDDKAEKVAAAVEDGLATGDLRGADFGEFAALVLAPGVPLTHPKPHWSVELAHGAGIPVIGDIELFDNERRARIAGLRLAAITGTNGKSTTTALLGHLLSAMGEAAQVGGNIGRPVLDLDPVAGTAVVECSSYQIDLAPSLAPDVGALLNLSPDHIDRHGTFEHYADVKTRLVAASGQAVIGVDDPTSARIAETLAAGGKPVHRVGVFDHKSELQRLAPSGVGAIGTSLYVVRNGATREVASLEGIPSLRGRHNAENAAAAMAMAMALGFAPEEAARHLATFPGLAHRMEEVGRDGAVIFVNDSKATNAVSSAQALAAFDRIHWIVGGVAKEGGVESLTSFAPKIAAAYLIGQSTELFERQLRHHVPTVRCRTLETALDVAARAAKSDGGVVLLSPASASFDQFRSFEHRGDVFRDLVRARLSKETA
ncbi:UDP-N-acetylmuramoyl-L-alanine--D-glutamate ligase [Acuticoccus sediminis]|uniref:UDP-N-acetylmuramoylalanine--D-glutamate ligase n=1 Tax=Acuticoccus sediminis TaxID=2184697 RepID=A0A8B2NI23_9HYPH|nr:UDP-N-acetylmuramoyl-L-alanine--D-glutamate ligase [Acuticoccus sediminis]RAH97053.1 UDP-N-acetylmuramoyl-L-alanine--D-glutamate ligase [Acuticoccus sediminis]